MLTDSVLSFGPFRFDGQNKQLYRGKQPLKLPPKALGVLQYLTERPGQLVTKDELFATVWQDVVVTDGALTECLRELRQALRDDARTPRFIETVHRQGYRFVGQLRAQHPPRSWTPPATLVVGREEAFLQLQAWLSRALSGQRQLIFVTGEPGIGKTATVDTFVARTQAEHELCVGRGQCIEQYGAGEAYLPVLEALGRLCRQAGGKRLVELLDRHAPSWLVQMPAVVRPAKLQALQKRGFGATQQRMLRELAEAFEVMAAERPLLLVLEDLHWSDPSTLDLLAWLARLREPARLLVLGSYRPTDVVVDNHPLKKIKQELQLHGQCDELVLAFLRQEAVGDYLTRRFGDLQHPADLSQFIHQRTDGNPLFMVNVIDTLVQQGTLTQAETGWQLTAAPTHIEVDAPSNIQQLIGQQLDRCQAEERQMLAAASVAGMSFCAAAVAAGLESSAEAVEERCEELVGRGQFLDAVGQEEWPDGTLTTQYAFTHALYREVLYERVPVGRRTAIHKRIGERIEAGYGEQTRQVAAELAVHFERGRDFQRAVHYLQYAGENALKRSAHQEARALLSKGVALLKALPDTPERVVHELMLHIDLGASLIAIKGYADPEVGQAYTRARELSQQIGETPQLFPVLWGLSVFYVVRGDLQASHQFGERLLRLADSAQEPALLIVAHLVLGGTLLWMGEFPLAREHLEASIAAYDPHHHHALAALYTYDPGLASLSYLALALWFLGYPDQALKRADEGLRLVESLAHPYSLAHSLDWSAELHRLRREEESAEEQAQRATRLSTDQGFPLWAAVGTILQGWALLEQGQVKEGTGLIRQGLATCQAGGAQAYLTSFHALLAEAYRRSGQIEEGLHTLAEAFALVNTNGERVCEAELYRLKGELLLVQKGKRTRAIGKGENVTQAEACFQQALAIARRQDAKSWELRAALSLSRLWQTQGRNKGARQLLTPIYGWFSEGFDTPDLEEAKALMEELA